MKEKIFKLQKQEMLRHEKRNWLRRRYKLWYHKEKYHKQDRWCGRLGIKGGDSMAKSANQKRKLLVL